MSLAYKSLYIQFSHFGILCSFIWSSHNKTNIKKLENVQRHAAIRFFRMLKFWFEVLNSENYIIRNYYNELYFNCDRMKNCCKNWAYCIKEKLYDEIGLGYIWCM